jgi:hypothetical protein
MAITDNGVIEGWDPSQEDLKAILRHYHDRPVKMMEDLGYQLADTQQRILRACQDHDRILVWSGNGLGKTAGVMMAAFWYTTTRYNAVSLVTSGNFPVLNDTSAPFLEAIHKRAAERMPALAAAATWKNSPAQIDFDDFPEWFLRFRSPRKPKNLEGRHGRRAFVVIDEADKDDVTEAHFSSATSTASSSDHDVVVAIANPPEDRSDVAYQKWKSDRWHTIEFSSFDSHNVQQTLGDLPDDDGRGRIPGLVDLDLVVEDYEAWNGYDWPGIGQARRAVGRDDQGRRVAVDDHDRDLDPRWYRKRLGVLPPSGQGTLRPWYPHHVDDAVERYRAAATAAESRLPIRHGRVRAAQVGTDIARDGGDRTVAVARYVDPAPNVIDTVLDQRPGDHEVNFSILDDMDRDTVDRRGPWAVDANGEGSGVADRLRATRPGVKRFDGGEHAQDDDRWYNRATEAYAHLGQFLKNGGMVPPNSDLEIELREASRVLALNEKSLRGGTTLQATGKDTLKKADHLGRSPDVMDAAALACYRGYSTDFEVPSVGGVAG